MNPSWNEKNNLQTKTMESNETTITFNYKYNLHSITYTIFQKLTITI